MRTNNQVLTLLILSSTLLILTGCQKNITGANETSASNAASQSLYDFCVKQNGTIISSYPAQCAVNGLIYFNETDNAMLLFSCTSYFDGCNTCTVDNGMIGGCTKKACTRDDVMTPKCVAYNETPIQGVPSEITANFTCVKGQEFAITFDSKAHVAYLIVSGITTELPQVLSADGAKYSNQKITFFNKGNESTVYDAKDNTEILYSDCTTS